MTPHQFWVASGAYSISQEICTRLLLCCALLWSHIWLIFPYPSGLLHWHCGNLTIAPVPAKQPWWIWINTSCEFIMNDCITTTKQSTTKPCAYFLGYTVIGCQLPHFIYGIHNSSLLGTQGILWQTTSPLALIYGTMRITFGCFIYIGISIVWLGAGIPNKTHKERGKNVKYHYSWFWYMTHFVPYINTNRDAICQRILNVSSDK